MDYVSRSESMATALEYVADHWPFDDKAGQKIPELRRLYENDRVPLEEDAIAKGWDGRDLFFTSQWADIKTQFYTDAKDLGRNSKCGVYEDLEVALNHSHTVYQLALATVIYVAIWMAYCFGQSVVEMWHVKRKVLTLGDIRNGSKFYLYWLLIFAGMMLPSTFDMRAAGKVETSLESLISKDFVAYENALEIDYYQSIGANAISRYVLTGGDPGFKERYLSTFVPMDNALNRAGKFVGSGTEEKALENVAQSLSEIREIEMPLLNSWRKGRLELYTDSYIGKYQYFRKYAKALLAHHRTNVYSVLIEMESVAQEWATEIITLTVISLLLSITVVKLALNPTTFRSKKLRVNQQQR